MDKRLGRLFAGLLAIALGVVPVAGHAEDPIEIHAIKALTGALAAIGKEGATSLMIAQDTINASGGINGRRIKIIIHDDQSNPQIAVQIVSTLLAQNVQVFLGPDPVAACNAVAPLIRGKAVLYCMSAAFHPPAHSYAFSAGVSTLNQATFVGRYLRLRGLTKIATMTSTDANGQDADRAIGLVLSRPENKGLSVLATEHFSLGDITTDAQMSRIKASGAQVIFTGNIGAPLGVILHGYTDVGLAIPLITNAGALTVATVTQYAGILPKEFLIPGALSDGPAVIPNGPERAAVLVYTSAFKTAGIELDHATNLPWDPFMIVVSALRKFGPNATASQINEYIENLHGWPGTAGRYDFRGGNQSGLDADALVMVRWNPDRKSWVAVSKPGGDPLP